MTFTEALTDDRRCISSPSPSVQMKATRVLNTSILHSVADLILNLAHLITAFLKFLVGPKSFREYKVITLDLVWHKSQFVNYYHHYWPNAILQVGKTGGILIKHCREILTFNKGFDDYIVSKMLMNLTRIVAL